MPAATVTDNFLTTTPWSRKTDFFNAFSTAITNAGFGSSVANYDRRDTMSFDWVRGSFSQYDANGSNSIQGTIRQVVLNNAKSKGTVQFDFFTVKNNCWQEANHDGVGRNGNDFDNQSTCPGICAYWGGWDSGNNRRTLNSTIETAIGGWYNMKPTSGSNNHNFDNQMRNGQMDGSYDSGYDSTWNAPTGDRRNIYPFGYHHSAGWSVQSWYWGSYGFVSQANPMCRLPHPNLPIQFKAINHPEMRGVFMLQQNRAPAFFGYVRPATLPGWWDEDTFPYVFIPVSSLFNFFAGFNGSYFPIPNTPYFAGHQLLYPFVNTKNTLTNNLDALSSPIIKYALNSSILGRFSNDFIIIPNEGVGIFDRIVVTAGVQEYMVINSTKPNGTYGSLAIRTI